MSTGKRQAEEAVGLYEHALTTLLEPMDQALQASERAGDALQARDVRRHLEEMALVVAAIARTNKALLENGRDIVRVINATPGNHDIMDRFVDSLAQSSNSLEQVSKALEAIGHDSDPKTAFTKFGQTLVRAVYALGQFKETLKAIIEPLREMSGLREAFEQAKRRNTDVWKASQRAVAQGVGKSGSEQAGTLALAVYSASWANPGNKDAEVQAQALALKGHEIALDQMIEAMSNAAEGFVQVYSLG